MTGFAIRPRPDGTPLRIIAIGAHCDDIEIGAGGLIRKMATSFPSTEFNFAVMTSDADREREARAALSKLVQPARADIDIHDLQDTRLPAQFHQVKDVLGELSTREADMVLVHDSQDAHQDHRLLGELAPTAFRRHLVAHFEIPKWDGDLGCLRPNAYVHLSAEEIATKWNLLNEHYVSQRNKDWFNEETLRSLARLRGMECRAAYAEAFRVHKLTIDLLPERETDR